MGERQDPGRSTRLRPRAPAAILLRVPADPGTRILQQTRPRTARGASAAAPVAGRQPRAARRPRAQRGRPETVTTAALLAPIVDAARGLDARWQRAARPRVRSVLFDARSAMEYGMMAPVHRRLLLDPRVRTALMSSDRPQQTGAIFRDAPRHVPVLTPREALTRRFDAYVAADLVWATLPRGTRRVQMFHGVAGKFSREYDRPDASMRHWDRLFFINRRRLQNYVASGAID